MDPERQTGAERPQGPEQGPGQRQGQGPGGGDGASPPPEMGEHRVSATLNNMILISK